MPGACRPSGVTDGRVTWARGNQLLRALDEALALAYLDASVIATEEADDPALGARVAEHRVSGASKSTSSEPGSGLRASSVILQDGSPRPL